MRRILTYLFSFLLSFLLLNKVYAIKNDSLTYKNDKEKFNILINIAIKDLNNNPKKAVIKLLDAYSIARKNNNLKQQIKAIKLIAEGYRYQNNLKQSLQYYYISKDLANQLNNNTERIYAYNNVGYIYSLLNDSIEALKKFRKSLSFKKYLVDDSVFSQVYNNIADVYIRMGNLDSAVNNFNKAYKIDKKYNIKPNLLYDLNNLGVIYYNLNKIDLALKYFKESVDSSIVANNIKNLVFSNLNIVDIELKEKHNFSKEIENKLLENKKLIFKNKLIDLYEPSFKLLIYYYKNKKDYKNALYYTDKYIAYNDSLQKINNLHSINDIKIKYETKNKEIENKLLKQSLDIQLIKSKKARNFKLFSITIITLLILLIIFIYFRIKTSIKHAKILEQKSKEISRINDAYLKLNKSLEEKIQERNKELSDKVKKLKKTESELLILLSNYKEANKIKETFLNNISNEIRTPLNSINGLTEMLNVRLKSISDKNCERINIFSKGIKQSV